MIYGIVGGGVFIGLLGLLGVIDGIVGRGVLIRILRVIDGIVGHGVLVRLLRVIDGIVEQHG